MVCVVSCTVACIFFSFIIIIIIIICLCLCVPSVRSHNKYIVWNLLIATSKLMVKYSMFRFAGDAICLCAVWSKFASD